MGTPLYFYTPLHTDGSISQPGIDEGEGDGVEIMEYLPPGMNVLMYDTGLGRCVIKVPYGTSRRAGWAPKHAGEVLTDYPGLLGVD